MRITDLNDFDISLRLGRYAKQYNVNLTLIQKTLYISFIKFCEEKGKYDEIKRRYYINLSVKEMVCEFKAGHTTVIKALKALSGCGAINRVKSSLFKSSETVGINDKTQAFITYINTDFLSDDKNI